MDVRPVPAPEEQDRSSDWEGQELAPGARGHMATFARELAQSCLAPGVQVVLGRGTPWPHQAISSGTPAPLAVDVVDLMVPSDCVVVPAERMPSPSARAAARAWDVDRLLVAPALFGREVLAVGLAPVGRDIRPDHRAVVAAGRRLATALAAWSTEVARTATETAGRASA
jgi:hypothetical protein